MNRPKCGCGNTQNPNGYCDGSHLINNENCLNNSVDSNEFRKYLSIYRKFR